MVDRQAGVESMTGTWKQKTKQTVRTSVDTRTELQFDVDIGNTHLQTHTKGQTNAVQLLGTTKGDRDEGFSFPLKV